MRARRAVARGAGPRPRFRRRQGHPRRRRRDAQRLRQRALHVARAADRRPRQHDERLLVARRRALRAARRRAALPGQRARRAPPDRRRAAGAARRLPGRSRRARPSAAGARSGGAAHVRRRGARRAAAVARDDPPHLAGRRGRRGRSAARREPDAAHRGRHRPRADQPDLRRPSAAADPRRAAAGASGPISGYTPVAGSGSHTGGETRRTQPQAARRRFAAADPAARVGRSAADSRPVGADGPGRRRGRVRHRPDRRHRQGWRGAPALAFRALRRRRRPVVRHLGHVEGRQRDARVERVRSARTQGPRGRARGPGRDGRDLQLAERAQLARLGHVAGAPAAARGADAARRSRDPRLPPARADGAPEPVAPGPHVGGQGARDRRRRIAAGALPAVRRAREAHRRRRGDPRQGRRSRQPPAERSRQPVPRSGAPHPRQPRRVAGPVPPALGRAQRSREGAGRPERGGPPRLDAGRARLLPDRRGDPQPRRRAREGLRRAAHRRAHQGLPDAGPRSAEEGDRVVRQGRGPAGGGARRRARAARDRTHRRPPRDPGRVLDEGPRHGPAAPRGAGREQGRRRLAQGRRRRSEADESPKPDVPQAPKP